MRTSHIPINLDLIYEALAKATKHYTYQMSLKFLIDVILCAQPRNPWHHLQENNTQTLWLMQDQAVCALRLRCIMVASISIWRWEQQNSADFDWTFRKS